MPDLSVLHDLNGVTYTLTDADARAALQTLAQEVAGKQDALTFDTTPTSGSGNPVTSGGVYTALQGKQDTLSLPLSVANGGTGARTAAAARSNLGAVSKAGDTMTGALTISQTNYPSIVFRDGDEAIGQLYGDSANRRMFFREYNKDNVALFEDFYLPSQSTEYNAAWTILTTKNHVTAAQGGTARTTATGAQAEYFSQIDANGNFTSTGISAYPTQAGVYRVNTSVGNLPVGYGCLIIFGSNSQYVAHLYIADGTMYFARTIGMSEPSSWNKLAISAS